ncbi:MAG TPA: glycosyltransferase [Chloroflexi bacterium]|nr:glycosyltransferase [Chloroflexota bacterium]
MRVSVIATVLNEVHSLPRLLDSLVAQTRPPDEVVVCDGGSTDGTLALLEAEERLPLRIVRRPGNISQGRNAAIEAATGDVIAVTDAGVRLSPHWLETITAPFEDAGVRAQAVAGFFVPDPQSVFETAMGATVLPEAREIDVQPPVARRFLPSSRSVAFRKTVWETVGGYPEWLDYCEDLIFDFRVRDRYGPFVFAPEAVVYFRPRTNLRAFFVQYYRYARGDGKADLWRKRHAIRYLTYLVAVPLIGLASVLSSPWWWTLYLISVPGMFWTGWRRLVRSWGGLSWGQRARAALWVPVIRVVGDAAKMLGYPVGLWWRWRNRSRVPDWRRS